MMPEILLCLLITANMAVISNSNENRTLTKQNLVDASQPLDATKNVVQSINYKIMQKQNRFKWYAKRF